MKFFLIKLCRYDHAQLILFNNIIIIIMKKVKMFEIWKYLHLHSFVFCVYLVYCCQSINQIESTFDVSWPSSFIGELSNFFFGQNILIPITTITTKVYIRNECKYVNSIYGSIKRLRRRRENTVKTPRFANGREIFRVKSNGMESTRTLWIPFIVHCSKQSKTVI